MWRRGDECAMLPRVPDRNTQWRIGALLAFAAFVWTLNSGTKARVDELEASVGRLEVAVSEFQKELRDAIRDFRTELRAR